MHSTKPKKRPECVDAMFVVEFVVAAKETRAKQRLAHPVSCCTNATEFDSHCVLLAMSS